MKKGFFYRAIPHTGGIQAVKTNGYIENDIGLHRERACWYATHIPTGKSLYNFLVKRTRAELLKEVQSLITERDDFAQIVELALNSDSHSAFKASINKQEKEVEK